jgi:hypothetical protein
LSFLVNYYWEKVKNLKILEHLKPMVHFHCLLLGFLLVYVLFVVLNHRAKFVFFPALLFPISSLLKVAYFTAIFPYIVLLILIIQSATLSGAAEGVKYYVIPNWSLVAKFEVKSRLFCFDKGCSFDFRLGKQLLHKYFSPLVLVLVL